MTKTLEDWQDAYYEQQANHTEATGMLAQERDRWIQRAQKAERELEEARAERVAALARLEANIRADERRLAALREDVRYCPCCTCRACREETARRDEPLARCTDEQSDPPPRAAVTRVAGATGPVNEGSTPSGSAPPVIRTTLRVLLNHVEPGFDNCKWVVQAWLDGRLGAMLAAAPEQCNTVGGSDG